MKEREDRTVLVEAIKTERSTSHNRGHHQNRALSDHRLHPVLRSYLSSPAVHAAAAQDPIMFSGPFVNIPVTEMPRVQSLVDLRWTSAEISLHSHRISVHSKKRSKQAQTDVALISSTHSSQSRIKG